MRVSLQVAVTVARVRATVCRRVAKGESSISVH